MTLARSTALRAAVLACSLAACAPAWAALGEPASSVDADRAALRATPVAKAARKGFTVHELQVGSTFIREYVSPDGFVFAVAWNGLSQPDLGPLLGKYATSYTDARRRAAPTGHRRRQRVETKDMVVETWGRMRDLHGRAWIPQLVPAGVDVHELS